MFHLSPQIHTFSSNFVQVQSWILDFSVLSNVQFWTLDKTHRKPRENVVYWDLGTTKWSLYPMSDLLSVRLNNCSPICWTLSCPTCYLFPQAARCPIFCPTSCLLSDPLSAVGCCPICCTLSAVRWLLVQDGGYSITLVWRMKKYLFERMHAIFNLISTFVDLREKYNLICMKQTLKNAENGNVTAFISESTNPEINIKSIKRKSIGYLLILRWLTYLKQS